MGSDVSPQHRYLTAILRPVMRYCLRNALKLQDLLEACKLLLVEEAERMLIGEGLEVSASRLAVLTGVHRKDVARFQRRSGPPDAAAYQPKKTGDLSARVLSSWENDPRFTTNAGTPRQLSFEGNNSEFAELVRSVSSELNPYTVLIELERAKAVERTVAGLKRRKSVFDTRVDFDDSLYFLETDSDDLVSAVEENIFTPTAPPNLHIKTEYDAIPTDVLPEVRKWILDLGDRFHAQVRAYLSKIELDHSNRPIARARVAVGTFSRVDCNIGIAAQTSHEPGAA